MHDRLLKLTPAAPAAVHLLLVALTWTIVGAVLLGFGVRWLLAGGRPLAALLVGAGLALGGLKAVFILRRAAARIVGRIRSRGDGRCLGGYLSWRTWLFVLLMIAVGRLIRASPLPAEVAGVIYTAVGSGLLVAAVFLWRAWRDADAARPG